MKDYFLHTKEYQDIAISKYDDSSDQSQLIKQFKNSNVIALGYDRMDISYGCVFFFHAGPYDKTPLYPKDVKCIYILPCEEKMARKVYNDCINFLPKGTALIYDVFNDDHIIYTKTKSNMILTDEMRKEIVESIDSFVEDRINYIDSLDEDEMDDLFDKCLNDDIEDDKKEDE